MRNLLSERHFHAEHEMNDEMKANVWCSAHENCSLLVHGFSGSWAMISDHGGERINGGHSYPYLHYWNWTSFAFYECCLVHLGSDEEDGQETWNALGFLAYWLNVDSVLCFSLLCGATLVVHLPLFRWRLLASWSNPSVSCHESESFRFLYANE